MDFSDDIWPWIWPTLIGIGWVPGTVFAARWLLSSDRRYRVEAPPIRRAINSLAGLSILCGVAGWLVMAPLPIASVERALDAAWPWVWPSAVLIGLSYLAWVLGQWFLAGLGQRLVDRADFISASTVRRVTQAGVIGSVVGAGVLWATLVPLPAGADAFVERRLLPWILPSLLLIGWIAGGVVATRRLGLWLAKRAEATETLFDDLLVAAIRRPMWLVVVISGVALWAGLVPMPDALGEYFDVAAKASTVLLIVMFTNAIVQSWLANKASP